MNTRWRLRVLEGVHAGATSGLAAGSYSVGSDFDCDIAVLDDGVSRRHLSLELAADGAYLSVCDGAAVSVDAEALIGDGKVALAKGSVVHCGAMAFTVEPPGPPAASSHGNDADLPKEMVGRRSAKPVRGRRWLLGAPVVAVLIALSAASWQLFHMPAVPREINSAAPATVSGPPAPPAADEIVNRVREFVGDEDLVVERGVKGEVIVSGVTSGKSVQRQLQRIQADYAGTVEIRDEVSYVTHEAPRQVQLPQRITDVHVGEVRWFRTADGGRYFEGSQLDDGAEVVRIGLDAIVFRREGRLTQFRPAN
jgi:hypothetical protein